MDKKTIDAKLLGILAELDSLKHEMLRHATGITTSEITVKYTAAYNAVQKAYML